MDFMSTIITQDDGYSISKGKGAETKSSSSSRKKMNHNFNINNNSNKEKMKTSSSCNDKSVSEIFKQKPVLQKLLLQGNLMLLMLVTGIVILPHLADGYGAETEAEPSRLKWPIKLLKLFVPLLRFLITSWLLLMLRSLSPIGGSGSFLEGDDNNIRLNAKAIRSALNEMDQLLPLWTPHYPMEMEVKYRLIGLVSHIGSNIQCGHCVAHVYKEGRWLTVASIKMNRPEIVENAVKVAERRIERDKWPKYYDTKRGRFIGKQARLFQTWSIAGYIIAKQLLANPDAANSMIMESRAVSIESLCVISGKLMSIVVQCKSFGDKDLDLRLANPLHLQNLLKDPRFLDSRIVLLHASYPFSREASHLASIYH
uniref:Alkaline/neutral invertase n=1 Tax=Lactuca sativa TaxID=4236 RepID=A0A9R1X7Y8_LACSA|nr:hypothetical protein LSAT_V11C600298710 [Lactuca sativa]